MGYSIILPSEYLNWMTQLIEGVKHNTYRYLLMKCMMNGFAFLHVYSHNDIIMPQHLPEAKGDIWMHVETKGSVIDADNPKGQTAEWDNRIPSESLIVSVRFVEII